MSNLIEHIFTIHLLRGRLLLQKVDCQGDTWEEDNFLSRLDNLEAYLTGKSVEQVQQEVATMVASFAVKQSEGEEE